MIFSFGDNGTKSFVVWNTSTQKFSDYDYLEK